MTPEPRGERKYGEGRYPTYVGLGARKAGTTLLHSWLADHPDICVPRDRKEVEFFTRFYDRGLDWYRSLFRPTTERAVGEFSVTYLESERGIARLARDLPEVKCLISLRDPVLRVESHYRDLVRLNNYGATFREFIAGHPEVVERGRYSEQLLRVLNAFPHDQVHVMLFEDAITSPEQVARELYEFVGVRHDHLPATLRSRVNATDGVRSARVQRARQRIKLRAVERDMRWVLRLARTTPLRRLQGLNETAASAPGGMDAEMARELRRTYADDIGAVSRMLKRDLSQVWRAGAEP